MAGEVDYYDVQRMVEDEVDYYDVQRMVEDEAINRRADDGALRDELAALARSTNDSLEMLYEEIRQLREGLRTLDAMRLDSA